VRTHKAIIKDSSETGLLTVPIDAELKAEPVILDERYEVESRESIENRTYKDVVTSKGEERIHDSCNGADSYSSNEREYDLIC
jgi:hypothetical protein